MDRPERTVYTPPPQRFSSVESISSKSTAKYDIDEPISYDSSVLPSLISLQSEYAKTFADDSPTAAEAFIKRKLLKQDMAIDYRQMVAAATNTFHARTRCPTCKQTPITVDYFETNHSLPKGAWIRWRDLYKKMGEQRPEILYRKDWTEFLGEMKTIEMWYWEDNTASVECGRVSWNGNFAPYPISSAENSGDLVAIAVPYSNNARRFRSKAVLRYGKAI
ncbi:hypothetical protein BKA65DRAFT_555037 [Rhexocercosporidium sp. MPI-PUGE-AT-0058]|nr:hypothetical protein BKA65DRAFT_555037 [Rhexocercosporidium sp. MPI-PUGE-AT-0058]